MLALGLLVMFASWGVAGDAKDELNFCCLSVQGSSLSATVAEDLELRLKGEPDDLAARILLTGYYTGGLSNPPVETLDSILRAEQPRSTEAPGARLQRHLLWIIHRSPESEAAAYLPSLLHISDPSVFRECRTAWLEQTKRHSRDARVLAHAAKFLQYSSDDYDLTVRLLLGARQVDPGNPDWALQLAGVYGIQMRCLARDSAEHRRIAVLSVEQLAAALALDHDPESRFHMLPEAAGISLEADHPDSASRYACEALAMTSAMGANWYLPIGVHRAWTVLGGIALAGGRLDEAEADLLASSRVTHNSSSSWYGPNLILASLLYPRGGRKVVTQFLDRCLEWPLPPNDRDQLKALSALVQSDRSPDFGSCLTYD